MTLTVFPDLYGIYRFKNDVPLPDWIYLSEFYSITRTNDELSVITLQVGSASKEITVEPDWRILKLAGPLDFSVIGIIAGISKVLSQNRIPIFTISTYDTDYILIKQKDLSSGIKALASEGYNIDI